MKKIYFLMVVFLVFILSFSAVAQEPVNIDFWYALGGFNGEVVKTIIERFNETHTEVQVIGQHTGTYNDTLTKTQAAVRSGSAPHVVQIYGIGTQVMADSGIIIPVERLGKEVAKDQNFDWGKFLTPVSDYYTIGGQLNSMPFNSSAPVLYYNRDAFEEVGLDPNNPPQTFKDLKEYARKLTIYDKDGNVERYGFTLGVVGWFVEQMVANQDALLVNNANGRNGRATEAYLNREPAVSFVRLWKEMVEEDIMLNGGRGWDGARQAFLSGRAAMTIESTAQVSNLSENAKNNDYELGTAFLPRPKGADRGGVMVSGASLWAIEDHPEEELKAVWEFLSFVSEMDQQTYWFENTGYFPVTKAAVEDEMNTQFFTKNPNHLTAFLQLLLSKRAPSTKGTLIGSFPEVRQYIEEGVEKAIEGNLSAQEAMDEATIKINKSLEQYNSLFE